MRVTDYHPTGAGADGPFSGRRLRILVACGTPIVQDFLIQVLTSRFANFEVCPVEDLSPQDTDIFILEGNISEDVLAESADTGARIIVLGSGEINITGQAFSEGCIALGKPDLEQLVCVVRHLVDGEDAAAHKFAMQNPPSKCCPNGEIRTPFTDRETQVFQWMTRGYRNKQIAAELGIQVSTVRGYVTSIFDKTGIRSRHRLVTQLGSMEL